MTEQTRRPRRLPAASATAGDYSVGHGTVRMTASETRRHDGASPLPERHARTLAGAPAEPVPVIRLAAAASTERPHVGLLTDEATFRTEVGRRLRALRIWDDLSQDELAARAGVTRNFVSGVERGAQNLDAWRLRLLTRALNISSGFLLCETPEPFPPDSTGRPRD